MAQPQHQYPPRPFSPLPPASAPHHGSYLPPNKRQRLSPNSQSPYNSPSMSNIALPNQVFSSPYYGAQPNGSQPNNSYNTMNAPPPAGNMGPPSRPAADKPTDMNELSDVLLGSGVDLREEEAALLSRHNTPYQPQHDAPFTFHPTDSLDSFGPNFIEPDRRNVLSQNLPGDRNSFYGAGTFNQPAAPYQPLAQQAETEKQAAIRRKAEQRQYHLNDPFLYAGLVQHRLSKQAHAQHVTVPSFGVFNSKSSQPVQVAVTGPDKHERILSLTGQDLLYHDVPLTEILTLLSLAAEERLRALVEDAAALAKGRRVGSHGVVPTDLTELAVGEGNFETVNCLPTPGNSAVSPKSNPLKRSYAAMNKPPTPVSNGSYSPTTTIAFPNLVAEALHKSAQEERRAEQERLTKRARRTAAEPLPGEVGTTGSTTLGTPALGLLGDRAPEVDTKKPPNKKEQKRQAEAKATEAQQHAATNKTTNMALGLKKKSWMTKDSGSSGGGSLGLPRVNTQGLPRTSTPNGSGSQLPMGRKYGEFREDKETGKGIQMRDMVAVLETDRKEKKALARAYTRLCR